MASVAHGRNAWSSEEQAHLAACGRCAAEWRLVQEATRLGTAAAARLDPKRVSEAVHQRLGVERRRRRWIGGSLGLLAAAAAVALVVWTGRPRTGGAPVASEPSATEFHLPLAELEGLDAGQLEAVLDGLEAPLSGSTSSGDAGLSDLQDDQLERVLRSLEG
jgi:anti-sigma factor RsiW